MKYINSLTILYYFLYIKNIYSIIVLPYQVSELREEDAKLEYSSKDFISDFIQTDYYSSLFLGDKNMRILARISSDNNTFILSEEECDRKSMENAQSYLIMTRNSYKLGLTESYKNFSMFNNSMTNYKNGGIITEIFSFYNTTKLKCHPLSYVQYQDKDVDTQINVTEFKIMVEDFNQKKMCAIVGLGKPHYNNDEEINFINELKKSGIIDNYYFTYKFITSSSGEVIIGGLPHEYYNNSKLYKEYQFLKINSNSANDYNLPWSILFNKIYVEDKNNSKFIVQNNAKSYIVPSLGFIIGTTQYKKLILEHYFNPLINEGKCQLERINNILMNNDILNLKNSYFDIFSCDANKIKDIHKSSFPYLRFQLNDFDFTFYFFFYYLFFEFKERHYFLVLFPEDDYSNDAWYLGLPFLRRYQFIFNHDSKTIGFYNENLKEKNITNDKNKSFNVNYKIIILIVTIILIIGLIYAAFKIGFNMSKQRKKRANELTDDNFEYFSKDKENVENNPNLDLGI